ncbi:hypothetical protein [Propionivibrio sp.]|uniref:hypothetical protein n=1 Tax=Propionivibrio sp. TaxID=2212460 RepID=UPI0025F1DF25|nr:hypothetical protein [Propionivibrio sp.]MBK8746115.1 hypothetical protein [Propionivibrio sp.]
MSDEIRVYVDACCFIDMAKKAKGLLLTKQKEDDVWFITKLLEAAKDGKISSMGKLLIGDESTPTLNGISES